MIYKGESFCIKLGTFLTDWKGQHKITHWTEDTFTLIQQQVIFFLRL